MLVISKHSQRAYAENIGSTSDHSKCSTMDEVENSNPPKKRLKMGHSNQRPPEPDLTTHTGHLSPQTIVGNMQETSSTSQATQDQREAEVGIQGFVSPDTVGFKGIFKKR